MLDFLKDTILNAGKRALVYYQDRASLQSSFKKTKDLVTEADQVLEDYIRTEFAHHYPKLGFLGEESGETSGSKGRVIVDPIDGTLSFARGHRYWSISVAVELDQQLSHAMVFAPALGFLMWAQKGKGAFKNGKPMQVSSTHCLHEAVVASGFACLRDNLPDHGLPRFNRVAQQIQGMRVRGSAALDLCMVADGELDAFFEQNLNLYDVAGGALILQEAGGKITDFSGKEGLNPDQVLASNGPMHPLLQPLM